MTPAQARAEPRLLDFVEAERYRPFGSDYAPQRLAYLFYLPFSLFFFAVLIWLAPGNDTFVMGALLGGLAGVYAFVDIVFRGAPLRLTTAYAMSLLIAYNLGAFNSWLTVRRASLTLAEFFSRDPAALARAIAACMATAAFLFVVGEVFERPIFGREFRLSFGENTVPLVVASTALLLGGHATGHLGFQGIAVGEGGHVNPLAALVMWWCVPAFAYSVCAALNSVGGRRWLLGGCAVVQLLALVPFGRRVFGFSLVLAFIASRLGRRRSRTTWAKKLLLASAALALLLTASLAFLYLRFAAWEQKQKTSLGNQIELAIDVMHKRSPAEILEFMGTDTSTRTFMIGFFSDLLDASQRSTPLLGQDMLYNLKLTVPSAISRDKFGIGEFDEEALANIQWGFAYIDEANSLLTAGAADFGMVGVLVYPLVMVLMLRALLEWAQFAMPTYLATIVALALFFESLQAEEVPVAYLIQIRNTLLVAGIFYLIVRLPKFRWHGAD
jgi:hypothetical protein